MVSEREDVQGAPVRVALIGCGVVGSAVARLLIEHADDLAARVGRPLELVGIGVRRPGRNRGDGLDPALFTTDSADLVTRADVVIEVVGGIEPARTLILRAMAHGASVVTANKALLAEDGPTQIQQREARKEMARIERALTRLAEREDRVHAQMAKEATDHLAVLRLNGDLRAIVDERDDLEMAWLAAAEIVG